MLQSRLLGNILELQPAKIVVKQWRRRRAAWRKAVAVHKKDVWQAVVVEVKDGNTRSGSFNDVLLLRRVAGNIDTGQSGNRPHIFILHHGWLHPRRQRLGRRGYAVAGGNAHLRVAITEERQTHQNYGENKRQANAGLHAHGEMFLHILANCSI